MQAIWVNIWGHLKRLCDIIRGGDHRDKNRLFKSIQVDSIVVPLYKNREKRFCYVGVHLNPPYLTWSFSFLAKNRLKMATGRKACSWLKWPKLDWYQLIRYYNTPRKYQEWLRQPQTSPRHLPDTPKYGTFWPIPDNWDKRKELFQICLNGCLSIACISHPSRQYPEPFRQPQTPSRHLQDTLQTPQKEHFDPSKATRIKGTS